MDKPIRIFYIGNNQDKMAELAGDSRFELVVLPNALEALQMCNFARNKLLPDAVLCESTIPGGTAMEIFSFMRSKPEFAQIAFILLAYEFRDDLFTTAFRDRVDDFYVLPYPSADQIAGRIAFLREFLKKLPADRIRPADVTYNMPLSKRLFDIFMASMALICLSPLLLLVVIAIRLESKGKVYYISKRVGREPFDFYKLRSMRVGADAELKNLAKEKNQYGTESQKSEIDFVTPCPRCSLLEEGRSCSPVLHISNQSICDYWYTFQKKEIMRSKASFIKIVNDPRVTRVGKIIRNTSIDELPQLINVLKGDMSIVGNRPLPVYEAEQLTLGELSKRFLAPAGITGLWQVELRGKGGVMSEEERKRLDNEYADHFVGDRYSFWYDINLILRTIPALFQKDSV